MRTWENDVEVRWREYFVQLLNVDAISEIGGNVRRIKIRGNGRIVK